mgnify:CR=1 FL=1
MTTVISVRFRSGSKTYYFDPQNTLVRTGEHKIVETSQGLENATCNKSNHQNNGKNHNKQICRQSHAIHSLSFIFTINKIFYHITADLSIIFVISKQILSET